MNTWIMPCNLKYFDIINRFENYDYVVWKNGGRILNGDIVYIYVGRPYSAIKYRCIVEEAQVDDEVLTDNSYARVGDIEKNRKYMKLKLLCAYDDGVSLSKLQDLGMFGVRKQTRLDRKVAAYMSQFDAGHAERG